MLSLGMNMRISSLRQETTGMSAKNAKLFETVDIQKPYGRTKGLRFSSTTAQVRSRRLEKGEQIINLRSNSISGEKAKSAFRKAAQAWRDNTCIDIYEDTCGNLTVPHAS